MDIEIKEIVDRYTILRLKQIHFQDVEKELNAIKAAMPKNVDPSLVKELQRANAMVWDLEAQVGKLAIEIRTWNTKRTEIKNKIAAKYGGHKDTKQYYATSDHRHVMSEVPTPDSKIQGIGRTTLADEQGV